MDHISMQTEPRALSDGYKRRLALAVQLVSVQNLACKILSENSEDVRLNQAAPWASG